MGLHSLSSSFAHQLLTLVAPPHALDQCPDTENLRGINPIDLGPRSSSDVCWYIMTEWISLYHLSSTLGAFLMIVPLPCQSALI